MTTNNQRVLRALNRALLFVCLVLGLAVSAGTGADEGDPGDGLVAAAELVSIPAARQADRVVVITVEGAIDATTALSVKRRIKAAEKAGFDAFVLEVDSPGGELGAVLEISNAIKMSTISNTISWVRPDAYSGGAIIALACNEIVTSDPASMGDAFIIQIGPGQVRSLTPTERTKFLPPLMADVTDSARRSGYDEYMVQAIVVDGIELWFVEEIETGRRLAVNEEEYRLLFGDEVVRGKPMLAEVTGGVKTYQDTDAIANDAEDAKEEPGEDKDPAQDETGHEEQDASAQDPADDVAPYKLVDDPNAYRPASPTLEDVESVFADPGEGVGLESPSTRPVFSSADRGAYRLLGYITDGSAAIVMRDDQLAYFGFSSGVIETDEELMAYFGADELVRVKMNGIERLVRFLTSLPVKFFLVAVFLIAIFVEMMMAGTGLAGAVAVGAIVLLLGPSAMIGLSGWWELIAIVIGLMCLAIELFVTPGVGIFGVIGFVMLFGGLIGTFVSAGGTMSNPAMQKDLMNGAVTVLLSFITAGIGWWLIIKNAQNLPLFDKLILTNASSVSGIPSKSLLHAIVPDDGSVRVGSEGVTTTPLHPIGHADFDGQIEDVYAAFGTIESGVRVRVVTATKMRIEVEEIESDGANGEIA